MLDKNKKLEVVSGLLEHYENADIDTRFVITDILIKHLDDKFYENKKVVKLLELNK